MWLYGNRIPKQLAIVSVANHLNAQLPSTRLKSTMDIAEYMRNLLKVKKKTTERQTKSMISF